MKVWRDNILKIEEDIFNILSTKTQEIEPHQVNYAFKIGEHLKKVLEQMGPVAAGLAAPQIGISAAVFIYSFDRKPENLKLVINPSFVPEGENFIDSYEACFSAMAANGGRKIAKMRRYEKIRVSFINEEGRRIEEILEGFAAKVFQHEYDHLQGYVNIYHPEVLEVKEFIYKEDFETFMKKVRKKDQERY